MLNSFHPLNLLWVAAPILTATAYSHLPVLLY
jgi:hypothetical protein